MLIRGLQSLGGHGDRPEGEAPRGQEGASPNLFQRCWESFITISAPAAPPGLHFHPQPLRSGLMAPTASGSSQSVACPALAVHSRWFLSHFLFFCLENLYLTKVSFASLSTTISRQDPCLQGLRAQKRSRTKRVEGHARVSPCRPGKRSSPQCLGQECSKEGLAMGVPRTVPLSPPRPPPPESRPIHFRLDTAGVSCPHQLPPPALLSDISGVLCVLWKEGRTSSSP